MVGNTFLTPLQIHTFKSEHKDTNGRFILVEGMLDDQLYTFVTYYALNRGQEIFFDSMFQKLGPLIDCISIIEGDSNVAFDSGLDKKRPLGAQTKPPRSKDHPSIWPNRYMENTQSPNKGFYSLLTPTSIIC